MPRVRRHDFDEVAESLAISPATVKREWQVAIARLYQEMQNGSTQDRSGYRLYCTETASESVLQATGDCTGATRVALTLAERAERIFLEAQTFDEQTRPDFLDTACEGEPELRFEVDALLAAAAESDAYFRDLPRRLGIADLVGDDSGGDALPGRAAVETGDFARSPGSVASGGSAAYGADGRYIGPYRLLRELGRGGMGSVWLAERADGLINRPVALKFPRGFWIRAGLRERMAREREMLASLEHPGIARLYDAGLTDSGDPWLAIQGVDPNHLGTARALTADEILEQAEGRIAIELAGQPHTRIRLRSLIGQSYLGLFEPQRARDLLEQALAEAEALPGVDTETLRTAHLLMALAQLELTELDEAENHLGIVLSMIDEGDDSADFIRALVTQSDIDYQRGDFEAAFAAGQGALDAARNLPSTDAALLMDAHKAIGKSVGMLRRTDESLEHNRRAFELALQRFGNDRDHPKVLETEHNLAASLNDVGKMDEAIPHLERSLQAARTTYGEDSLLAGQYGVRLGLVHLERGELDTALELIDSGIRIEDSFEGGSTPARAGRRLTLARAYIAARRMSDAAREADAAADIMAQLDTPFMMRVVEADQAFARAAAGGPIPEAIGKLEEVIEGQDAGEARYKTHLPDIYVGTLHLWNGDAISAIRHLERGVELARAQTRVAHLAEALTWLGHARLENGDPAGAGQALEEGLELLESVHFAPTPARAEATVGLARVALANGEADAALAYLEDADRFWAEFDPDNRAAGIVALWLGQAQAALDRPDEAEASFARAKRLLAHSPLPADNTLLAGIDGRQDAAR